MSGSPPSRRRLRLGRRQRLHGSREFARMRLEGERRVQGCLIANWRRLPAGDGSRLGIVTSRKVGGAVVRSRARRLLREAFRLQQHQLAAPVALVLVARRSVTEKDLGGVMRDLRRCLQDSGLLAPSQPPPPSCAQSS